MNITPARRGRPRASTADAIEQSAMPLLLDRGYDAVSVEELAAVAGIGRATFFRYYRSKAAVVWRGFDRALDRLEAALAETPEEVETLAAVRAAVAVSVRAGVDDGGTWWSRFLIMDTAPSLRAEAHDRWERWTDLVGGFVAQRMAVPTGHPFPAAIAWAHEGVYLAVLRSWRGRPGDPEEMLRQMLAAFETLDEELAGLLDRR